MKRKKAGILAVVLGGIFLFLLCSQLFAIQKSLEFFW